MSWWSSVVGGVKAVGSGFSNGAKWVWNNASLSKVTMGLFTYTANTTFQVLEQGLALRNAVPTLINNENARKIVSGMAYVAVNDVLPLVLLNYGNNTVQGYFRAGHEEDAWLAPYSAFLSVLTLVNYGVQAYTWRQGAQTFLRITILDSVGPAAFNSNKTKLPPSLCTDLKCDFKRKLKGMGREPLILLANDAFTSVVSYVPYVGQPASSVLGVFFNGRYITRLVTPERCERHKAMMQESVLALGLTYEASIMLMDYLLKSTVGIPPFLYYRTMKHLLLLLHINLAAHMNIPLVEDKDATLMIDPLNIYERICRFIADVIFAGLMKRIPIDFKPVEGAPPLIPLSPTLKLGTKILNSGLEQESKNAPGFFSKSLSTVHAWVAPPVLQSGRGLINDPIVSMYWPGIQQGSLYAVETILSYRESKVKSTLAWIPPKGISLVINLKFGVSRKLTQFLIMLSKEEDFWNFVEALKFWLERNKVKTEVTLVHTPRVSLHGEKKLISAPPMSENNPSLPAEQLVPTRASDDSVVSADQLIPVSRTTVTLMPARTAESLFTTRRRSDRQKNTATSSVEEQRMNLA